MGKMLKELERMGYVARDIDGSDKRAKEIRLTQRGVDLATDTLAVVEGVRAHYADKVGPALLDALEGDASPVPFGSRFWGDDLVLEYAFQPVSGEDGLHRITVGWR